MEDGGGVIFSKIYRHLLPDPVAPGSGSLVYLFPVPDPGGKKRSHLIPPPLPTTDSNTSDLTYLMLDFEIF